MLVAFSFTLKTPGWIRHTKWTTAGRESPKICRRELTAGPMCSHLHCLALVLNGHRTCFAHLTRGLWPLFVCWLLQTVWAAVVVGWCFCSRRRGGCGGPAGRERGALGIQPAGGPDAVRGVLQRPETLHRVLPGLPSGRVVSALLSSLRAHVLGIGLQSTWEWGKVIFWKVIHFHLYICVILCLLLWLNLWAIYIRIHVYVLFFSKVEENWNLK